MTKTTDLVARLDAADLAELNRLRALIGKTPASVFHVRHYSELRAHRGWGRSASELPPEKWNLILAP